MDWFLLYGNWQSYMHYYVWNLLYAQLQRTVLLALFCAHNLVGSTDRSNYRPTITARNPIWTIPFSNMPAFKVTHFLMKCCKMIRISPNEKSMKVWSNKKSMKKIRSLEVTSYISNNLSLLNKNLRRTEKIILTMKSLYIKEAFT